MTTTLTYDPYYAGPATYVGDSPEIPAPAEEQAAPVDTVDPALEVPEGSAKEILEWVGDDRERASAALAAEQEGQARKTLIAKLQGLLEG